MLSDKQPHFSFLINIYWNVVGPVYESSISHYAVLFLEKIKRNHAQVFNHLV